MHKSFHLLVTAGVCWGTGGVTGRALAEAGGVSAPAVAAYRLLIGGALLVALLAARGRSGRRPVGADAWRRVFAVAALAAAFQASYFAAVAVSSVTVATLVAIGSAPILVVVVDAASTRKAPRWGTVRPVLLGLTGLVLLVSAPSGSSSTSGSGGSTLLGVGLSVLAGAGFALLTLLGRRPVRGLDEATTTGYGFLLGGAGLATALAAVPGTTAGLSVQLNVVTVLLLLFLGTVPTAVAYTLFFRGLRSSTAATATVVALLEPLTATVLAVALLGERLSAPAALGAALLLISVLDSGRSATMSARVSTLPS